MVGFLQAPTGLERAPASDFLPHNILLDEGEGLLLLDQPGHPRPRLAVGCALAVEPRSIEMLEEGACLQHARLHEHVLVTLPLGSAFQSLTMLAGATSLPAWEQRRTARRDHPVVQSQLAAIRAGLPHQDGTHQARLRRVWTLLTLRVPLAGLGPAVTKRLRLLLMSPERSATQLAALLLAHQGTAVAQLQAARALLEQGLRHAEHTVTRLDGVALGQAVAQALQPMATTLPTITPEMPLAGQVLSTEARNVSGGYQFGWAHEGGAFVEDCRAQVLTLHAAPPRTYPGILSAPRAPLEQEPLALWDQWDGPVTIAVNIAVVDRAAEAARLNRKRFFARLQKDTSAENAELNTQLDALGVQLFLGQGQLLWGRVHVVLWGQGAALPSGLDRVEAAAKRLHLRLVPEHGALGATLFPQTLPLGFDKDFPAETVVNRARRLPIQHLAMLGGFYGGVRGTRQASIAFLNQRGEPVYFDPFDSPTNPHMILTGTSGAGKTHTLAYMVNHLMALRWTILIIDPLERYRWLCAAWQGRRQTVTFAHPPCTNPFLGDLGPAHRSFIAAFLNQLASGSGDRLIWEHYNVLGTALGHFCATWDRARGEPTLTHFVEEVLLTGAYTEAGDSDGKAIGVQIARKLQFFWGTGSKRGQYADFVDGPNTLRLQPGLNVIELAELQDHQDLRGILFFAIAYLTTTAFRDPHRFPGRKAVWFDELWALDDLPETAKEVDKIVRTYRNFGTMAGFISQLPSDFDTPMGKVIRGLASSAIFLQHESAELTHLKRLFALSDVEVDRMRYARKHQGWAAAYLRLSERQGGIVRLVSDRAVTLQMSQDAAMVARREQALAAASGDMEQAFLRLLKEEETA